MSWEDILKESPRKKTAAQKRKEFYAPAKSPKAMRMAEEAFRADLKAGKVGEDMNYHFFNLLRLAEYELGMMVESKKEEDEE